MNAQANHPQLTKEYLQQTYQVRCPPPLSINHITNTPPSCITRPRLKVSLTQTPNRSSAVESLYLLVKSRRWPRGRCRCASSSKCRPSSNVNSNRVKISSRMASSSRNRMSTSTAPLPCSLPMVLLNNPYHSPSHRPCPRRLFCLLTSSPPCANSYPPSTTCKRTCPSLRTFKNLCSKHRRPPLPVHQNLQRLLPSHRPEPTASSPSRIPTPLSPTLSHTSTIPAETSAKSSRVLCLWGLMSTERGKRGRPFCTTVSWHARANWTSSLPTLAHGTQLRRPFLSTMAS
jgi:hypothetical protein